MQNRILNIGYVTGSGLSGSAAGSARGVSTIQIASLSFPLLEGGKMIRYGAKTIAAGGLLQCRVLRRRSLLVGDCAGFLNSQRLKGIHSAIKSGMLAAEAIFDALVAGDFSANTLQRLRATR